MKITKNKRGYKIDLSQFELDALGFVAARIGGLNKARLVFSGGPDSLIQQYWRISGGYNEIFKTTDGKTAIYIDLKDSKESVPVKSKKCKEYNRNKKTGRFCQK